MQKVVGVQLSCWSLTMGGGCFWYEKATDEIAVVKKAWKDVENKNFKKYLKFRRPMQVPVHGQ